MTESDKFTVNYFMNLQQQINQLCQEISVSANEFSKLNGDFLYAEDLQKIEDRLKAVCEYWYVEYEFKNWYNLTTLTYIDINKWLKAIEDINERKLLAIKYSEYTSNTYEQLLDKNYFKILYEEE